MAGGWRKTLCIVLLALLFGVVGCAASQGEGCASGWVPASARHFPTPAPGLYHEVAPVVWRYFHYRKQAVLQGDIHVLWQHYPALAEGMDGVHGVNAEADLVAEFRGLPVVDGDVTLTDLRVSPRGEQRMTVYVHASEMYLIQEEGGELWRSGGEVQIMLYLRRAEDGGWTVERTDEVTEAELPWELP